MIPFKNKNVEEVFLNFDSVYRKPLLEIRELIFEVAQDLSKSKIPIGNLEETLKWSQPSYCSKIGTPVRLFTFKNDKIAILFHCQTTLIEKLKTIFKDDLEFSDNRAIVIDPYKELPLKELAFSIEVALTYYKNKL